jgi:acetyl-CoA acetyltransferase
LNAAVDADDQLRSISADVEKRDAFSSAAPQCWLHHCLAVSQQQPLYILYCNICVITFTRPQVTDGAAAVLMMTRREALKRGLPVLGIFRSFAAVGVDPAIMGVGPAVAIPAAVEKVREGLLPDSFRLCFVMSAASSVWDQQSWAWHQP